MTFLVWMLIRLGDYMTARTRLQDDLGAAHATESAELEAEVLYAQAVLEHVTGDLGAASDVASEAVAMARKTGQPHLLGRMLNMRAAALEATDPVACRADYAEALACFEAAGDQRHVAIALNNLGILELQELNLDAAQIHLEAGLGSRPISVTRPLCLPFGTTTGSYVS